MRIVENGKGVTFIPELALSQLSDTQLRLVRPFALPEPRRDIIMLMPRDFIRRRLLAMLVERIQSGVKPLLKRDYKKEMPR
jgi:LysR family hydrogen peroxide-inducible transcriptional activator